MTDSFADRARTRENNFGAMRLTLAIFVIFGHMFAAFGGEWDRHEILMFPTGQQMDLGALAVNAFFAISGYLITLSWLRTPDLKTFLAKRALRIYPGFVVASIVSITLVAPLAHANMAQTFTLREIVKSVARIVLLSAPKAPGAFAGEPWPVLNLPLWTIRYEFICYLLVPFLVFFAARFGRIIILALYAVMLTWHAMQGSYLVTDGPDIPVLGSVTIWPRFFTYFLGGMVVAHWRDRIPFRHGIFILCMIALVITGLAGGLYIATATAGIYVVFYFAYQRTIPLHKIGTRRDLSYGAYLYGWPVEMLLVHHYRDQLTPWSAFMIALPIALLMALISWYCVESPALREKEKIARELPRKEPAALPNKPATIQKDRVIAA